MQYTMLEVVQLILSAMDSDEVDSYTDTTESVQVANLLRSVFYDIASDLELPQQSTLLELTASGSALRPVLMTLPSNLIRLNWIKYDNKATADTYKDYQDVLYVPFEEFIVTQTALRENTSNVGEMTFTQNSQSYEVLYESDRHPTRYTTTNDSQLIFNSFDSTVDTTLQTSKTMAHGLVYPVWTMSDVFVPPLEPSQFSYFINKAKARAFLELKQMEHKEAMSETRVQKVRLQRRKQITPNVPAIMQAPRYGR